MPEERELPYWILDDENAIGVPDAVYKGATFNDLCRAQNENDELAANGFVSIAAIPSPIVNKYIHLPDGSVSGPGLAFASETNTGLYRIGSSNPAMSVGGTLKFDWDASRLEFASGYKVSLGLDTFASGSYLAPNYLTINDDVNAGVGVTVRNSRNGTGAAAGYLAWNDVNNYIQFTIQSSGLSPNSDFNAVPGAGILILGDNTVGTGSGTTPLLIGNENNGDLRFGTNNTERGRFTAGGDFRINQLTQGSVLFAGASGHVTQDNANLHWNDTENRLGVGRTPSYALDVCGDPSQIHFSEAVITGGGFLISTSAAQAMIAGGANWNGATYTARATGATLFGAPGVANGDFFIGNKTSLTPDSSTFFFDFRLYMDASGNFGINTGATVARRFEVLDDTNPQLRLTHTAATDFCDFQVDTSGNLTVNVSGTKVVFSDAVEIDGALDHDGTTVGLYGATPVVQGTGGQDVTNSVTDDGSTAGAIPDITDGTVYANDYQNLRRALYQLARMLKQDHDQLRDMGILT